MQGLRTLGMIGVVVAIALVLLLTRSREPSNPENTGIGATAELPEHTTPMLEPAPDKPVEKPPSQTLEPVSTENGQAVSTETAISLRGWVGDASGTGLEGIDIQVESQGFDGEEIVRLSVTSDNSGEFQLENIVPQRQYRLEIKPQASYAAYSIDSFTAESAEALQKIVLPRVELVDVEGMIVDTNLAPVADFELSVRSLAVEFPDRVIRSDATGYFELSAFPAGELRIATNASDYCHIKGLELKPDEYHNLTLMIDRGNYYLAGRVFDNNGAPLPQVQVGLKSAFAADGYHSFSYRSTVTDDSGSFAFERLGGHPATLEIHADGFQTFIRRHEFESFSDSIELWLQPQD